MLERTQQTGTQVNNNLSVEFRDVSLSIQGSELISNINCQIHQLGITVLMGPNGAGKTLFLKLLCGLRLPTNGKISCHTELPKSNNNPSIAMLFQQPVLLRRSSYENIEFVLRHFKIPKQDVAKKAKNALEQARLENRENIPARLLSGGERQRLALARALVVKPEILLLDEVTASLDPASVVIVEEMIANASQQGTKVIFITHDIRQAKRIADDILFIHQGRLLSHNSAVEFFRKPGSIEAQAYLDGCVPDQLYRSKFNGQ